MSHKPAALVIDPDKELGDLLSKFFQTQEYACFPVQTVNDAIRKLEYQKFDFILLDPSVKGGRVEQLLDELNALGNMNKHSPLIIISSDHALELPMKAAKRVDDIVYKPFEFAELMGKINDLMKSL